MKLAPRDETSPIRTFYLRLSTREEAEAWAHAIRGTRFDYVREERDALRVAKNGLADQVLNHATSGCGGCIDVFFVARKCTYLYTSKIHAPRSVEGLSLL